MDSQRQVTQQHYDLHAQQQQQKTTAQVLKERQEGPAAPLKRFHNEIKRRLIYRFGYQAEALIDYACGRGGDLNKWDAARIGYVQGLDISGAEIQEAERRFGELRDRRGAGLRLQADFQQIDTLGTQHYEAPRQFDVATCMFAIHYFFDQQDTIRTLMETIAANLKPGGYFIGCVPDGKRVKAHLAKGTVEQRHLRLKAASDPPFKVFGSKYIMEIPDTVVEGHEGFTEGSEEYMVFDKALLAQAAKAGLHPVLDYQDPAVDALFETGDAGKALKHFAPTYPDTTDASLKRASEIYMAFVFQKVADPQDAKAPPVPPPETKGPGGPRGGPGGGRGQQQMRQQQQQGGRGGNDRMSSLTWQLPYASNHLPPDRMPITYHNLKTGPDGRQTGLEARQAQGRWVIFPPVLPIYSGPVQYDEHGRELLLRLPNGYPIRNYGQELDYWRQQREQEQQQQQHGAVLPPAQPAQHQQQGHGGMAHAPNGMQQQQPQQQQYPQPPRNPLPDPPGSAAAAAGGGRGGRGTPGGRGGGRKAPSSSSSAAAAAAAAAEDASEASTAGGRGRGRGGGGSRGGGRAAGSKRGRPAEDTSQDYTGVDADGEAAADDAANADHVPAAKKQAVYAAPPAAVPNSGAAAPLPTAASDGIDAAAAGAAAAAAAAGDDGPQGNLRAAGSSAAAAAAAGGGAAKVPQSADAKLAKVKAADPLDYKERQEPAPLSQEFLEAMIRQAPPYADS